VGYDVIIIGGGLAGLTSAVHLSKKGMAVLLLEKNNYPKHKVCGEYISNEVLPYLKALGFNPFDYGAKNITDFTLSTSKSNAISTQLPFGGFGISRYCIDWELAKKATENGAEICQEKVIDIQFNNNQFTVFTNQDQQFTSEFVIGAFGKRSNLDVKMKRKFIQKKTPFLGIKAHYKGDFPENAVELHNFKGGYCGVSKVETGDVNVCYIANYKSFKKHKNSVDFQQKVLSKNTYLKTIFDDFEMTFEKPITISQVSFSSKKPVENHILMCGDSAGMIHPLAGNGMSMAIRAAQMVSQQILDFKSGKINSRTSLETQYTKNWNKTFHIRLTSGHIIAKLFQHGLLSEIIMLFLKAFPFVLPHIIKRTHGKPMKPEL
jgi:flavin-dependent dehydrogenase